MVGRHLQSDEKCGVAFEPFDGWVRVRVNDLEGYQFVKCHMIFDVKMGGGFRRKARMVADGHMTESPSFLTNSSVVSRDSVMIALTIAALNGLSILSCDIQNAGRKSGQWLTRVRVKVRTKDYTD